VVALLDGWGRELELSQDELVRWRAAGHLHDALKSTDPIELRAYVEPADQWPDPVLHGLACAARLRLEGVRDESVLTAIAYHSTGHADLDLLGELLYLADYLEPGRKRDSDRAAALRDRLPGDRRAVLQEVAAARIRYLLEQRLPILVTAIEFWNRLAREECAGG
jgi:HD superfamily phosphohydrolase YqeK